MMTMGWRMSIAVDADGGRVIGSKICMRGRMMGIVLSLDEVITERQIPYTKVWQTIDANIAAGSAASRRATTSA